MALFEPLFEALERGGVRYVLVGGLAVVMHGFARLTADVDLCIDLTPAETRRAIDLLTGLGLRPRGPLDPRGLADQTVRESWIKDKGMKVFSMWDPTNPMREVDLFVEHPMPFDELWSRAVEFQLATASVRVASIEDLIFLKRLAGRPQDHADIEALEEIDARTRPKRG